MTAVGRQLGSLPTDLCASLERTLSSAIWHQYRLQGDDSKPNLKDQGRISQVAGKVFKVRELTSITLSAVYHFYLNRALGRKKQSKFILFIELYGRFQKSLLQTSPVPFIRMYKESSVSLHWTYIQGYWGHRPLTTLNVTWLFSLKLCSGAIPPVQEV